MEKQQVELLELINNDLGQIVTQMGEGKESRFFLGQVELPEPHQTVVSLAGKEVTHFFKLESIRKSPEQLKTEINEVMNTSRMTIIKFNVNTPWYVYSKI